MPVPVRGQARSQKSAGASPRAGTGQKSPEVSGCQSPCGDRHPGMEKALRRNAEGLFFMGLPRLTWRR
ncbi:hypothetical protein L493_4541 [Bordetella bronchiseptica 99-R-0433]|nr:hypothetical protein L493_4541 [Bordetella bronchiseptica 99-R-0433]